MSPQEQPVTSAKPARRWFPRVRFSLRTLLLFVLLIASGGTLWWNWEPWGVAYTIKEPAELSNVFFSNDDQFLFLHFNGPTDIPIGGYGNFLDVRQADTGKRIYLLQDSAFPGNAEIVGQFAILRRRIPESPFGADGPALPVVFNFTTGKQINLGKLVTNEGDAPLTQFSPNFILSRYKNESVLARLPNLEFVKSFAPGAIELTPDDKLIVKHESYFEIHDLRTGTVVETKKLKSDSVLLNTLIYRNVISVGTELVIYTIPNVSVDMKLGPSKEDEVRVFNATSGAMLFFQSGVLVQISSDGKYILINDTTSLKLYDCFTGKVLTSFGTDKMQFSPNGKLFLNTSNCQMFNVKNRALVWSRYNECLGFWKSDEFVFIDDNKAGFLVAAENGRSLLDFSSRRWHGLKNWFSNVVFTAHSGTFCVYQNDQFNLDDENMDKKRATVGRLCRPWQWYGFAWLPEFWLTLVLGAGLVWSLFRDRRMA